MSESNRRITTDDGRETHWIDAAEVAEQLDLPGEPIMVDLAGRNLGFVIPGGDDGER